MNKKVLLTLSFCLTVTVLNMCAQVKPSSSDLKYLWDFENGTAGDRVGNADGLLHKDATISNGILELQGTDAQAGYVELPADIIEINTFQELTAEMWATANEVPLQNPNMLIYFGTTQGSLGYDYFFYTPGRRFDGDPGTRVGVSIGTWNAEDGINYTSLDDEQLHHHVITWKDSLVILYVDGDSVASNTLDSADTQNWYHIATTLSNDSAYIGKGGYSSDPTWKGTVELVALWDKVLSADEVQWLYEAGAKREPIVDGINSLTGLQFVNIYAVDHHLYIENVPDDLKNFSVTIYSITGGVVYQKNNFQNGTYINLEKGMYVVKIQSRNSNYAQKVILH